MRVAVGQKEDGQCLRRNSSPRLTESGLNVVITVAASFALSCSYLIIISYIMFFKESAAYVLGLMNFSTLVFGRFVEVYTYKS